MAPFSPTVEGMSDLVATRTSLHALAERALTLKAWLDALAPNLGLKRINGAEHPEFPGAKELYQEASNLSYQTRQSSPAHSHPPPPVTSDDDK